MTDRERQEVLAEIEYFDINPPDRRNSVYRFPAQLLRRIIVFFTTTIILLVILLVGVILAMGSWQAFGELAWAILPALFFVLSWALVWICLSLAENDRFSQPINAHFEAAVEPSMSDKQELADRLLLILLGIKNCGHLGHLHVREWNPGNHVALYVKGLWSLYRAATAGTSASPMDLKAMQNELRQMGLDLGSKIFAVMYWPWILIRSLLAIAAATFGFVAMVQLAFQMISQ